VFGGEMQFAHFLFFLREAIAIPMAVIIFLGWSYPLGHPTERSAKLGLLPGKFQEKTGLFLTTSS
jgi:hypothetical protein